MKRKYSIVIVLFCLIPVMIFIVAGVFSSSPQCQHAKEFFESNYNGILAKKYIDSSNHGFQTFVVYQKDSAIGFVLTQDTTLFFDYASIGDSVIKNKNDDFIEIHRPDVVKKFRIYFGCKSQNNK